MTKTELETLAREVIAEHGTGIAGLQELHSRANSRGSVQADSTPGEANVMQPVHQWYLQKVLAEREKVQRSDDELLEVFLSQRPAPEDDPGPAAPAQQRKVA